MKSPQHSPKTGVDNASLPVFASEAPIPNSQTPTPKLLAVDCGLKTGLALYTLSGQLLWYRSQNFGTRGRLKKAAWSMLQEIEGVSHLVIEGGGPLAEVWFKAGARRQLTVRQIQAEQWRKELLLPRQQRTGKQAKQVADELAREIIDQSGATRPTSLRHDAAEAILVGKWFLLEGHKQ